MAYQKKKKYIQTPEDKAFVQEKLNAYKKWHKPYKGEIVLKLEGCEQDFVFKCAYATNDELEADAHAKVDSLNAISNGKKWTIASAKLVGQSIDDELEL